MATWGYNSGGWGGEEVSLLKGVGLSGSQKWQRPPYPDPRADLGLQLMFPSQRQRPQTLSLPSSHEGGGCLGRLPTSDLGTWLSILGLP